MIKELQALKRLRQETIPATYMQDFDKDECCDIIEQALKRLEAIDNANPREALNITKATEKYTGIDLSVIKNSLIKTQKMQKVLEILKKHFNFKFVVDGFMLLVLIQSKQDEGDWDCTACANLANYKEEYDLLKEWLNNG